MRIRRTVSILAATAVVAALSGAGVPARCPAILYVSPRGSDRAAGSASDPLKSPQVAVDRLGRSGGTVQLAGGRMRAAASCSPVARTSRCGPPPGRRRYSTARV
jgi:hypothetical protein